MPTASEAAVEANSWRRGRRVVGKASNASCTTSSMYNDRTTKTEAGRDDAQRARSRSRSFVDTVNESFGAVNFLAGLNDIRKAVAADNGRRA